MFKYLGFVASLAFIGSALSCKQGANDSQFNREQQGRFDSAASPEVGAVRSNMAPLDQIDPSLSVDGGTILEAKPDKVSEEPVGLPGYPLLCRWQKVPTSDTSDATVRCFLANEKQEPAQDIKSPQWTAESDVPEVTVKNETTDDGQLLSTLSLPAPSIASLLSAVQGLKIRVSLAPGHERATTGLDQLKAPADSGRGAAFCSEQFFTFYIPGPTFLGRGILLNRFNQCELLASTLSNQVFPDPGLRNLPARSITLKATCASNSLTLNLTAPGQSGSSSTTLQSAAICIDIAALINSLEI